MVFYRLRKWLLVRKMPVFQITPNEAEILREVLYGHSGSVFLCWRLLRHSEQSETRSLVEKIGASLNGCTLDSHLGTYETSWMGYGNRWLLRDLWIEKLLKENGYEL